MRQPLDAGDCQLVLADELSEDGYQGFDVDRKSVSCCGCDSRCILPAIPAIDKVTGLCADDLGSLPQPVQYGLLVCLGGRTAPPSRHDAVRFHQWQLTAQATNGKAARLDQFNEPVQKSIERRVIHGLAELNPNLEHEFLELTNAQLLALPAIQASNFSGRRQSV